MSEPESYFPLMPFPLRRLFCSLLVSIALHAALAMLATTAIRPRPQPRIDVLLPPKPVLPADGLLKNTQADAAGDTAALPVPAAGRNQILAQTQQQRLVEHVYYPPEAVSQGLEGEVRLLLLLDGKGRLREARVASSSGHQLLDQAALAAAQAAGVFPGAGSELLLPVVFRLSD